MEQTEPRTQPLRSLWVLKILLTLVLAAMMVSFGFWWEPSTSGSDEELLFVSRQIREWKDKYGDSADLRVAEISVGFFKDPVRFDKDECIILAPVALQMEGIQEVLEIAAFPAELKRLNVGGIQCVTWEYAGMINRDISMKVLALVKTLVRPGTLPPPDTGLTIETLPNDLRFDALSTATDLKEHALDDCVRFKEWVRNTAGNGSGFDQFTTVVNHIRSRIVPAKSDESIDDICKAIRKDAFTLHRAHVIAIMAARELGIPCFGFAGVDPGQTYLVGMYSDAAGWMFVNLEDPAGGFMTEAPVFLTCLPIIGSFEGTTHDFWMPQANLVTQGYWGQSVSASTRTGWQKPEEKSKNIMTAVSRRLVDWP